MFQKLPLPQYELILILWDATLKNIPSLLPPPTWEGVTKWDFQHIQYNLERISCSF